MHSYNLFNKTMLIALYVNQFLHSRSLGYRRNITLLAIALIYQISNPDTANHIQKWHTEN